MKIMLWRSNHSKNHLLTDWWLLSVSLGKKSTEHTDSARKERANRDRKIQLLEQLACLRPGALISTWEKDRGANGASHPARDSSIELSAIGAGRGEEGGGFPSQADIQFVPGSKCSDCFDCHQHSCTPRMSIGRVFWCILEGCSGRQQDNFSLFFPGDHEICTTLAMQSNLTKQRFCRNN